MDIQQLGPYRIGRKLGKGGMGSVFEALDGKTQQRVAVKVLSPQLAAAEGFRERFEAEIESLKKLQHEGIVRLYGYGEHDGLLFYSMELVDGASLDQEINDGRRFDWSETLSLAVQICRALKHAHDHGVVHRDIKPANLLLADGHRVKIADFGIARLFGATQLTNAGGVLGTADFMSPEQADGRAVTEKCDQYSLGCVMFAALAGRPPFRAKTMPEMLQLQRFAEPEPVRRFVPDAPEQLDRLILQLLSKDPAERFPNVLVLARHMEAMQKALSRPGKTAAPVEGLQAIDPSDPASTAVAADDATQAPQVDRLIPGETTDSDVYNAATLADDDPPRTPRPALPVEPTPPKIQPTPALERRFTTVDEDAQQRARQETASRWVIVMQGCAFAAALAALAWAAWRLTRPASADALYAAIAEQVEEHDVEELRTVSDEIASFLQRFPEDARAPEIRRYAEELELQRLERRLRAGGKLGGAEDAPAVASVLAAAVAMRETDPSRAAAMLEDLLTVYPHADVGAEGINDQQRAYLTLAQRQLDNLRSQAAEDAERLLPELKQRLAIARRAEGESPEQAAAMYRSLINLFEDKPWAAKLVQQARDRLQTITASK